MAPDTPALTRSPAARDADLDRMRERAVALRGEIGTDVRELKRRARSGLDLGRQVAKHPIAVAAVFVVGVLAAAWIARSLVRRASRLGETRGVSTNRSGRPVSRGAGRPAR